MKSMNIAQVDRDINLKALEIHALKAVKRKLMESPFDIRAKVYL